MKRAALVVGFAFLFFLHLPFYSIIIHQMNWNPELQVITCRHFAVCQMFLAETSRLQRGQLCTFCCRAGIAVLYNLASSCLNMHHLKKTSTSINHLKHFLLQVESSHTLVRPFICAYIKHLFWLYWTEKVKTEEDMRQRVAGRMVACSSNWAKLVPCLSTFN